ncbi:hypothetical protein GKC30_03245 [Pseudodesulfovibrio sp. F-1]|uniref:Heavy-metal-associated domain-containing protein n=1 Tax=Pseudodesulfovibrio alkaliphilus TaxID=2661613 RepID=A0A7K1KKN6_9BACT|nr:hypothetical protein [Pseudodesulfovibrio alkaliphilus]MUM76646.1 hypothetical protein [Pseudodesulfovibrio alkaliphilus]
MNLSTLMTLRDHLKIQHHVPGRIRIKFTPALLADPRAMALRDKTTDLPAFVREVRVNVFTRDIVIEYDPKAVVPEALHEALTTADQERLSELAAQFETV